MDLHLLPELRLTLPLCIHWDTICQHLDHVADRWQKQVQELGDMNQRQARMNEDHRTLRSEHRHILRTQGHAATKRNRRKYGEYNSYNSHLFHNIHDDEYLEESQKEPRMVCSGFAHFSTGVRRVAELCKDRRAPLLIATKLGQLHVFSERFCPTDSSIASRINWPGFKGTIMEWLYTPCQQALHETANHFLFLLEHLHLAVVLSPLLGNDQSFVHRDGVLKSQHAGQNVDTISREPKMPVATQPVVEEIVHSEPAAIIDQDVAVLQVQAEADDQFAQFVERRLENAEGQGSHSDHEACEMQGSPSDNVYLLSFRGGKGEFFRKMFLQDKEFKTLRTSLELAGCPVILRPSGTIALVKRSQYFHAISALANRDLKRYQLLISESVEYLVDEVLARMSKKSRPYARRSEREAIDAHTCRFVHKRTFICKAPNLITSRSVAQSTTEAVRSSSSSSRGYWARARGINPRRCALGSWDE